MKYSFTRLTLFALISAIEDDLRRIIINNLPKDPQKVLINSEFDKIYQRFIKENNIPKNLIKTEELIYYTDFKENIDIINRHKKCFPDYIKKIIGANNKDFEKLVPIRNRVAHTRPLDFEDFPIVNDITENLCKTSKDLWSNLNTTRKKLNNEPSFVLGLDIPTSFMREDKVYNNLPLPEFDETGFIGREKIVEKIKQLCFGPYPVISIVGDGGQGKTALALKVANEIIESEENTFEAIIWSTSKTMQLTNNEIKEIDGAITNSIGIFKKIDSLISPDNNEDPIESVLTYLKSFKILLIIDNLETVLDERIKGFLEELPKDSKVIITSRIGLGAFEYPVKLQPMDSRDSINLLRSLASIRDQQDLVNTNNKTLAKYCNKMNNNPGYIKWFISAVQSGKRPEEVLDKPDIFLEFCMSNVYEFLDSNSKRILRSLLCLNGSKSSAELAYINDIGYIELQKGLHNLLSTNMVQMRSTPKGSTFESKYEVSEFARQYLSKKHPIKNNEYRKIKAQQDKLITKNEKFKFHFDASSYSIYCIDIRSESDKVIAYKLIDALNAQKIGNYQKANDLLDNARNLAPDFFEVRRCEAWIKSTQGLTSAAEEAYLAATELEPNNPRLLFWYAGFVLRYLNDAAEAQELLQKAYKIDHNSHEIAIEFARVSMYLEDFNNTERLLFEFQDLDLPLRSLRIIHDLKIQNNYRLGEYYMENRNITKAISSYEKMMNVYNDVPEYLKDDTMKRSINKSEYSLNKCYSLLEKNQEGEIGLKEKILDLLSQRASILSLDDDQPEESVSYEATGTISKIIRPKYYGFIISENGKSFFFHRESMIDKNLWYKISIGTEVGFNIGTDTKKREFAEDVIVI